MKKYRGLGGNIVRGRTDVAWKQADIVYIMKQPEYTATELRGDQEYNALHIIEEIVNVSQESFEVT